MKKLIVFFAVMVASNSFSLIAQKQAIPDSIKYKQARFVHDWNAMMTDIIMEDGFSPAVISKHYAYANIAAYTAAQPGFATQYRPLTGQLNRFDNPPMPDMSLQYDWRLCAISAYKTLVKKVLYRSHYSDSMYKAQIEVIEDEYEDIDKGDDIIERSIKHGENVGKYVIAWFKDDGHTKNQGRPRYNFPKGKGKWEPTPPEFADPLDPWFKTMRTLVLDSASQFRPLPPINYDEKPNSPFYDQVMQVYITSKNLTLEQKEIAAFWDCNPIKAWHQGHFVFNTRQISPGGHWLALAKVGCDRINADMMQAIEAYTLVGTTLFDAFTACWNEKYSSHYIRPVTFINKYIDSTWEPYLQTPPFPEHISGHSTISSASAEVLTRLFGEFSYADSTEIRFGLPIRSFPNYHAAAYEASISRIYGGIHFRRGCDEGNRIGKEIGGFVWDRLNLRKPREEHKE
jgi:hypothetical protein